METDDNKNIWLIFDHGDITLDHRIKTKDGWVAGVEIIPISPELSQLCFRETMLVQADRDEVKQKNC